MGAGINIGCRAGGARSERLPVAIRSVSKFVRTAKTMANTVKDELSQELKIQELQDNLRKAEQMGMKNLSPELQSSIDALKKAAQDVQRPYAKDATENEQQEASPAEQMPASSDEVVNENTIMKPESPSESLSSSTDKKA